MSSISKSEFLTLLQEEKKKFDLILNGISDEIIETKIVINNQSIKEMIAHITYWDNHGIGWTRDIINNQNPNMPWLESNSIEELKEIQAKLNQEMNEKNKIKPLKKVLEDFNSTFLTLLKTTEELTENQYNKIFRFNWTEKRYSTQEILFWRINHMRNHGKDIKDCLKVHGQ